MRGRQGGVRVGDGGEVGTIGRLLPEVEGGELGARFDGGAALAGGDEKRAVEVEAGFEGEQFLRIGRVGDVQGEPPVGSPEGGMEDAGGEARPAHAHEHDISQALTGDFGGEGGQPGSIFEALLRGGEEAEAVADLSGIGLPDGVVAHPDAANDFVAAEGRESLLDGGARSPSAREAAGWRPGAVARRRSSFAMSAL